jgi:hypothetical protein
MIKLVMIKVFCERTTGVRPTGILALFATFRGVERRVKFTIAAPTKRRTSLRLPEAAFFR